MPLKFTIPFKAAVVSLMFVATPLLARQDRFTTWERVFWVVTGTNRPSLKVEQATECALPGETLEAEADPSGNWGFPNEGFQMSVRFDQADFRVGEPIVASIIVRNVHNGPRRHMNTNPDQTEFIVTDEMNHRLPRKDLAAPDAPFAERLRGVSSGGFDVTLPVGTQQKYKLILSDMFDLTAPGAYEVTAFKNVFNLDETGFGQIMSGTARIRELASTTAGLPGTGTPTSLTNAQVVSLSRTTAATGQTATIATAAPSGAEKSTQSEGPAAAVRAAESQSGARSSSSRSETGDRHLGIFSSTVRIGASVFVLLVAAAFVYILLRRARRPS